MRGQKLFDPLQLGGADTRHDLVDRGAGPRFLLHAPHRHPLLGLERSLDLYLAICFLLGIAGSSAKVRREVLKLARRSRAEKHQEDECHKKNDREPIHIRLLTVQSFLFNISLTIFGFAFPPDDRMTCPTKKPKSLSFPPRYAVT